MVDEFADFSSPELSESLIDSFLEVSPEDFRHDYRNEFKQGDGLCGVESGKTLVARSLLD